MKPTHLQTNHLFTPIGIDETPSFSWFCEGGKQSAYRIIVKRGEETVWDSGKTVSRQMNGISYQGKKLRSRDHLEWILLLWDENDKQSEEISSFFEMGLLDKKDWQAKWIKGNYKVNPKKRYPVDLFRKKFEVDEFETVRLYASAKGVYDIFLNGKRIEDFILAPGITDYRKRIQYQTYDVKDYLTKGTNTLELRLADGWYRGSSAAYGVTNVYGKETSIIAQLEIDGKIVVKTDESFDWSNDGPIEFADLKDGESVDANRNPSYASKALLGKQEGDLVSSNNVYVKEKEHFKARPVKKDGNRYVFDFTQNIAGYLSFGLDARKGDKLIISCGEMLNENDDLDMSNFQLPKPAKGWNQMSLIRTLLGNEPKKNVVMTPLQRIVYTCKEGYNEYKTSFAVFGFRYIEVISDLPLKEEMFESIAVYSDMEETGMFECSDELLNQFVSNVRWSMKSNFLDIPTDCPTRERLGWTGDAQIFFNSASYLMDISSFFRKWLKDMEDAQYKNGVLPAVLPYEGVEMMYKATGTSVGWADAVYLIPYYYYRKYNDIAILKQSWPMIRKYAEYLFNNLGYRDKKEAKADPKRNQFVYEKGVHLGEWLEPEEFRDKVYGTKAKHPEECTAYLHLAMRTIAEIGDLLGERELSDRCRTYVQGTKEVYNDLFVKDGNIDTMRQAKLVRPLALGLLEGETKKSVEKQLKKAIEEYDFRVGTGFLSTPYLLPVLSEAGYSETAYKLLLNEKSPGWLSEVKQGATTIWEDWEGKASLNHYSPGSAVEWLFNGILGINVETENRICFRPVFDQSLDHAKGSYRSIYGDIEAEWKRNGSSYLYQVRVPANVDATLYLKEEKHMLKEGLNSFEINE